MAVCVIPIVVITVPAKKKELLRSHKLVTLDDFPEGFTPARMADITCCNQRTREDKIIAGMYLHIYCTLNRDDLEEKKYT